MSESYFCFFFQAEDGIRDGRVTGVQTCALPISALKGAARFVVNVLAADQEAISRRFAAEHANRFDGIGYRETRQGLPVLEGVLASIECDKHAEAPGDRPAAPSRSCASVAQSGVAATVIQQRPPVGHTATRDQSEEHRVITAGRIRSRSGTSCATSRA